MFSCGQWIFEEVGPDRTDQVSPPVLPTAANAVIWHGTSGGPFGFAIPIKDDRSELG